MSTAVSQAPKAPTKDQLDAQVIDKETMQELKQVLHKALFNLYLKHPFYALLVERCQLIATHSIERAGITANGKLFFNPKFVLDLTEKQVQFLMAHEIYHCVFRHHIRCGSRDPEIFNVVNDYYINYNLAEEMDRDALIPNICYINDSNIPKLTSEDLYEIYKHQNGGNSPRGEALAGQYPGVANGMSGGIPSNYEQDLLDGGGDLDQDESPENTIRDAHDETPQSQEEWEAAAAQAAARAKMQGKLPAHMDMQIKDMLKPRVDWTKKLTTKIARVASRENKTDYDWLSPSRRFVDQDIFLPSLIGYKSQVATGVDTSGSMWDEWQKCASDIEGIRRRFGIRVYHMWWDADVYVEGWLEPHQPFPVNAAGGGGTSCRPAFEHLEDSGVGKKIDAAVFFTDGWMDAPEEAPPFKVIWVTHTDADFPFGEVIRIKS